jgi:hypothetical protein
LTKVDKSSEESSETCSEALWNKSKKQPWWVGWLLLVDTMMFVSLKKSQITGARGCRWSVSVGGGVVSLQVKIVLIA